MGGRTFQTSKIQRGKLRKCMPAGEQVGTAGLLRILGALQPCRRRDETSGERGPALGNPRPRALLKFHHFIYVPM